VAGGAQSIQQQHALLERGLVGQVQGVAFRQEHIFGIAAVGAPAQQAAAMGANIAPALPAKAAFAAEQRDIGGHAAAHGQVHAGAHLHHGAGGLVAGDALEPAGIALVICPAHAVGGHADQHLSGAWRGARGVHEFDDLVATKIGCLHGG
jgi:hypothetical protein